MPAKRIIPALDINNGRVVKCVKFENMRDAGDPVERAAYYDQAGADELVFLDIAATKNNRVVSLDLIKDIGEEANMPFSAGGGISSIPQIRDIVSAGAEKVIIGSYALLNPGFIKQASDEFGSSTITVCIDVKKKLFGKEQVWSVNGSRPSGQDPLEFARLMEKNGAGEIIIQSIEQDGKMNGYNQALVKKIAENVSIPVIALGGAGSLNDLKKAHLESHASGLAAGSLFVYYGSARGVLINYPEKKEINFN